MNFKYILGITLLSGVLSGLVFGAVPFCVGQAQAAQVIQDVGKVVSLQPEAYVKLAGQGDEQELKPNSTVGGKDYIRTGETGTVDILFNDQSTVSLSPGSSAYMERFLFENSPKDTFSMHLTSGMLRVVTGLIVKNNPEAYKVETPQASIGIRGTDCTVVITGDTTKIIANKITNNNIIVTNMITLEKTPLDQTGFVVEISGKVNKSQRQASPEEMALMN